MALSSGSVTVSMSVFLDCEEEGGGSLASRICANLRILVRPKLLDCHGHPQSNPGQGNVCPEGQSREPTLHLGHLLVFLGLTIMR